MRFFIIPTLLLVVGLAACSGSEDSDSDTNRAIMYTMTYIQNEDTPNQDEPRGAATPEEGKHDFLIPASGSDYVEGTCEWDVSSTSDGGWIAKYSETWNCADYNALAGNDVLCTRETGRHEWDYQVAPDGTTELVLQSGEPAPEGLAAGAPGQ